MAAKNETVRTARSVADKNEKVRTARSVAAKSPSNMSVYKAQTVAEIIESSELPNNEIKKIHGRPDCHSLVYALSEIADGAVNVSCPYSEYGYLWLVLCDDNFATLTGTNVNPPGRPPEAPTFGIDVPTNRRNELRLEWERNKFQYEEMLNAEKAFIKLLKGAISDEYVKLLGTMFLNQPQRTFRGFFNQCWEKWGSVTART